APPNKIAKANIVRKMTSMWSGMPGSTFQLHQKKPFPYKRLHFRLCIYSILIQLGSIALLKLLAQLDNGAISHNMGI
ncbi:hypothetical protein ACPCYY_22745, partial [Bacillus pumilus]|uniref:hypothetical protein n=1 Tax=Bacillus pumilus TaxID=1408 RepID=UPI003C1A8DC8